MKKTLKRCAALLSAILLVSSCNSSAPTVVDNPVEEQPVTMECYAEAYASLVSNLMTSLQSNQGAISTFEDIDKISVSVYTELPQIERYNLERFELTGSSLLRSYEDIDSLADDNKLCEVLEEALLMTEPHLYSLDSEELYGAENLFRLSESYQALSKDQQRVVETIFLLLDEVRLPVVLALEGSGSSADLRSSPGDRMIMSESVKNMSQCQISAAAKITINAALSALTFLSPLKIFSGTSAARAARATHEYATCNG